VITPKSLKTQPRSSAYLVVDFVPILPWGFCMEQLEDRIVHDKAADLYEQGQRQLSTLMSNMPGMAYRYEGQEFGHFSFLSDGCRRLTGYNAKDFLEKKIIFKSLIAPNDRERVFEIAREALKQKRPFTLQYEIMTASGAKKWVCEQGCGVYSVEGDLLSIEGFTSDITPRKLAESALAQSEEFHRSIFQATWDGMSIITLAGYFVEVNPAFCRMLGYTREELLKKHVSKIIHSEHRHQWSDFVDAYRRDGVMEVYSETQDIRKDGHVIDIEISSSVLMLRGEPMVLAVCRDVSKRKRASAVLTSRLVEGDKQLMLANEELAQEITERKKIEVALRANKARYQSLVNTLPYGVDEISSDGTILFANKALHKLYACDPGSLVGQSVFDRMPEKADREQLKRYLAYLVKETPPIKTYIGNKLTDDGRKIEVQIDWEYNFNPDGSVRSFTSVVTDTAERRHAEQNLNSQHHELAHVARVSTMGEMATGIAHELNQPLAAIVNYTRGCIRRLKSQGDTNPDELVNVMQGVADEAERAAAIIQRMRDFVKKGDLTQASVDINEIVKESLQFFNHEFTQREVDVNITLADEPFYVFVDRIQLSQVLVNIIRNALEAVSEVPFEKRRIELRVTPDKSACVKVEVYNSGPTLAADEASKAFDPFYTTKSNGMGMGLAISRTIIEAHGGELKACADQKDGACFVIVLPKSKVPTK
jgi:PAS domain S-box-containing protein